MKLATTATPDFAALRDVFGAHDAGFKAGQLARRRAHYAALFQRYQDLLTLDDEGYEVSITLKSATKAVTLSASESEDSFDLTVLYGKLGKHMGALQEEILDLLADPAAESVGFEGTDEPLLHEVLALCLPSVAPPADAQPTKATTAKAA